MNKVETILVNTVLGNKSEIIDVNTKLEKLIDVYNKKGYKVLSLTPLTSGEFDIDSYGFGYTSGIVVVFEKVGL
ncbi:MAG: hypothetical protein KAG64_00830 [Bacteroidales bacterium]|nr:hypothetical protein [Bacteroidales bacterium]